MSIKRIDDKLIYTGIPLVWILMMIPSICYLVLALFKLTPFGILQQIAALLYGICLLLTFRYCKIVFDLRRRAVDWTKFSSFKKECGSCPFDQVKELAVDRVWNKEPEMSEKLIIPEGINYECTGCGKCCGGWAIPMTQDDYERITEVDWGAKNDKFKNQNLFRELKDYEMANTPYSYAIKPGADGHCPFLVDNLCYIHSVNGPKFKPSICQLFPYSFNQTPTGTYATISFVSVGAINNSGKSLLEQRDYLESKFAEFKALYPEHKPNWSCIALATGVPLTWDEYMQLDEKLIACMGDTSKTFEERFIAGSDLLIDEFNRKRERLGAKGSVSPALNWQDKQLIKALRKIYFPVKPLAKGEGDFNFYKFLAQVVLNGAFPVNIDVPGNNYSIEKLAQMPFPQTDPDISSLIYRYFFSRLFGKHYFGAGFGQLSVITGFHHLAIIYALIKLQSKASSLQRGAAAVSYLDVASSVKQLEKRLGETSLDGMAAATFELLMFSPNRMRRIMAFS